MEDIMEDAAHWNEIVKQVSQLGREEKKELLKQLTTSSKKQKIGKGGKIASGRYSLEELESFSAEELSKSEPTLLEINGTRKHVHNWTSLVLAFVTQLSIDGFLHDSALPIKIRGRSEKYFISREPVQPFGRKADFRKVGESLYVDVKYNAYSHINNLISALESIMIKGVYKVFITL